MTLIVQSPATPGRILAAIVDSVNPDTISLGYAVAYVTHSGSRLLVEKLREATERRWEDQERTLVTCFDFGYTEPSALTFLQDEGFSVRIANLDANGQPRISPPVAGFHPKFYLAQKPSGDASVVAGSANLSRRALTVNYEAVSVSIEPYSSWFSPWQSVRVSATELSPSMLESYAEARSRISRSLPDEPSVPETLPSTVEVDTLENAVVNLRLNPAEFSGFWLQVGFASGGSQNQVELPRMASRFFGFEFHDYGPGQVTIGRPSISTGLYHSTERLLTWHGDNRMERINVPTVHQGGERVMNRVVFFQRTGDHFLMQVVDSGSYEHQEWRSNSASAGTLYRLGRTSATLRQCGLI